MVEVIINVLGPWTVPEALLVKGARTTFREEGIQEGEASVTLVDDVRMEELNREYFGRSWPTDVIAFGLHEPGEPILGDIYLGFEQAERQATELGVSLDEELLRLTIHGTLHLLGHDHPEGEGRLESEMFSLQERLVRRVLDRGEAVEG